MNERMRPNPDNPTNRTEKPGQNAPDSRSFQVRADDGLARRILRNDKPFFKPFITLRVAQLEVLPLGHIKDQGDGFFE